VALNTSTNKSDHHDIAELSLKVALNTSTNKTDHHDIAELSLFSYIVVVRFIGGGI
jgi:hypothetical protein